MEMEETGNGRNRVVTFFSLSLRDLIIVFEIYVIK